MELTCPIACLKMPTRLIYIIPNQVKVHLKRLRIYSVRINYLQWTSAEIRERNVKKICIAFQKEIGRQYIHQKIKQICTLHNKSLSGCHSHLRTHEIRFLRQRNPQKNTDLIQSKTIIYIRDKEN